jgi:hypothetical protein
LGNQRQVADIGAHPGKGRVEAEIRADDAQAVGAQQADAEAAGNLHHLALERGARVARLGKAGSDYDDILDAAVTTLFDDLGYGLRSRHDDGHFDAGADLLDRLVRLDALDCLVRRIDRVETPLVARIENVSEKDVAYRILSVGSANDGDGFGLKQGGEVVMF